jgi:nucleoside-diphosphate-sugar epimerase
MTVLITGAAGNLGGFLARHLAGGPHALRLLIHRTPLHPDLAGAPGVSVYTADLADPDSLVEACRGTDCIVHFAGLLFAPRPERFLPTTNVTYVRNLVGAALAAVVRKFILISFPHVEGESSPAHPATGRLDGQPASVHAQTRLTAERHLLEACHGAQMTPVVLRAGMIYGRGVLMIEAARWLAQRRLLAVWRRPTWIHPIALPDFLECVRAAIERETAAGIYNLGDDRPLLLQEFLDRVTAHWGCRRPWRAPQWAFYAAAACCEAVAAVLHTASPLTRDFIRIGMASYASDTSRMKRELLPHLAFPTLVAGLPLL